MDSGSQASPLFSLKKGSRNQCHLQSLLVKLKKKWEWANIRQFFKQTMMLSTFVLGRAMIARQPQMLRCLLLRQDRCLLLRQDRCLLLRQDRCLLLRQDRCLLLKQDRSRLNSRHLSCLNRRHLSCLNSSTEDITAAGQRPAAKSQLWQCHNVQVSEVSTVQVADRWSGPKSSKMARNGSRMVARV